MKGKILTIKHSPLKIQNFNSNGSFRQYSTDLKLMDLFVLGCFTGLRYSDSNSIKSANIKGDFIHFRQGKTMNQVIIPLNKLVKKIIHKYNDGIPEGIHMNDFNKLIKGIAKDTGIKYNLKPDRLTWRILDRNFVVNK